ncbi:MAG: hypothetical protein GX174_08215 [Lentisphaerae bacterium]|jgi:hypothetical protein|nr:hypothetical protein [Lentisphaerota bacterium]
MEKALQVLNELERNGELGRYAIGGAMAATFYIEPVLTFDLDIFVVLPEAAGGLLTLAPLYQALRTRGYTAEGDCVMIESIPVQFLPAFNPLLEEALAEARNVTYGETPTRVLRIEHLAAIAVQTGRAKDRQRVALFADGAEMDQPLLKSILERYGLETKWAEWMG